MTDLIERKKAIETVEKFSYMSSMHDIQSELARLPAVDAEPVRHGHWKPFDEDEYTCSVCGNIFVTMDGEHPLSNGFKFCPFCGAKMDEVKDGSD